MVGESSGVPATFQAALRRWPGESGWVFAMVPDQHAPDHAGAFGRVPVVAAVDGRSWPTSVWCDRTHGWLLAVPARIRRGKDVGDIVTVVMQLDHGRV